MSLCYGSNNPSRYTDPTGHRVCDYDCQVEYEGADPAYKHYCEGCEWDVAEQRQNSAIIKGILDTVTEMGLWTYAPPVALFFKDINGESISGWDMAFAVLPLGEATGIGDAIVQRVGKYGSELTAIVGEKGFSTFGKLKNYLGPAGDGLEWHHIVEQSQIGKSGFLAEEIHNTGNVIAIDKAIHRQISGFFSSNIGGPGTQTVRNWLAGQSFEAQYEFGIQVLQKFGVIP